MKFYFYILVFASIFVASSCFKIVNVDYPGDMTEDPTNIKESLELRGHTVLKINGEVVFDEDNAIQNGLRGYFRDAMDTNIDQAINSLFDTAEKSSEASTQVGDDGISIFGAIGGSTDTITLVTVTQSESQTFGRKWKGTLIAPEDDVDPLTGTIGHGYTSGGSYDTIYANQNLSSVPVLNTNDKLEIFWEIYIQ